MVARPQILYPLFARVRSLPGVGSRYAGHVARVAGERLLHLCWTLPANAIDRALAPGGLAEAPEGSRISVRVKIGKLDRPPNPRAPWRLHVSDPDDEASRALLVFFRPRPEWIAQTFPAEAVRVVSGTFQLWRGRKQMTHPDRVWTEEAFAGRESTLEPVYPLTEGLPAGIMAQAVARALEAFPDLEEWRSAEQLHARGWASFTQSLRRAHAPQTIQELAPRAPARMRLASDELFADQLAMAFMRARRSSQPGRAITAPDTLAAKAQASLPFTLTDQQNLAIKEILDDMGASRRMLRLLQGDVGAGKTIVAAMAALRAVEAGTQVALMAPTETLARQHYAAFRRLCDPLGVRILALTGRIQGTARRSSLKDLATGKAQIAIGTHTLFQDDTEYADLGLAIVDEQHRFGVEQRLRLAAKNKHVDTLSMTATPIPRTLALTAYGDMDVTIIAGRPPGRVPCATRAMPMERLDAVCDALARLIDDGGRAFWVCPLVDDGDETGQDAQARAQATGRAEALEARFPGQVALAHGRMKRETLDTAIARFRSGSARVLVATTVVEVGVDVPEADAMVIEGAERFGLAQLHQLRGRVGRGSRPAFCLLLYQGPLTANAEGRLRVMRETDDGFAIAEEDLRLRGAGEFLGERQSGLRRGCLADPIQHQDLLEEARAEALATLARDPDLRAAGLRDLLHLFERGEAIRWLRSG